MPARQTVTFEDPVTNTEAFYQLVEVRPRVIKHKIKVRPQVEGYEVSVGGGYTAPCHPGPLQANYYDDYRNDILTSRRSRTHFLDDHAIDDGYSTVRHSGYYLGPRAVTGPVAKSTKVTKAITDYSVTDDLVMPRPRLHAVGDSTINVSKRTIRTASPPPAPFSTFTSTAPVLTPLIHSGFGRTHKTEKSSFSNQVDLIGKRASKVAAGSKGTLYNVSLADGLEFIRSMLTGGGSGFSLAAAIQAAKSADIDPYGRKAKYNSTMGDGWVGPTENWREKVRKWEQEELSQLEVEQQKRKSAAFQEWEERMGEAEVMESGRAERIKQLQQEWAQAEVLFREEAMEAERARISRLNAKSIIIEEIDVDTEAKLIKEQKEKERKAALAKVEAERKVKEQREDEEKSNKAKEDVERKRLAQEAERKKIEEEKMEARRKEEEERKRIEEEHRKKKEEEERKKREEEEERLKKQKEEERKKREEEERIKREEEERLRKEKEEEERIKREEEERLRKEEEERLRFEEEEKRQEEEATAKKFGLSGFGSFGADPFESDEDEEEEAAPKEEEAVTAAEEGGSTGPLSLATAEEEVAATDEEKSKQSTVLVEPKEVDEGTELIVKDDEPIPEISIESPPETIAEEEEHPGDSTTTHPKQESSWQESEVSSGATIEAESGKRSSVKESIEESTFIIEEEETTIVKRRRKVNKDGTIVEEEETETIPGSSYTVTGGGDLPAIDIDEGEGEDLSTSSSSSYKKTTFSSGGGVEEEEGSVTRRSTTTTVTEETETKRTLKQKASIDTHNHEIIIYNKDGVEITRVTHGDVIVGFDKVDEVVMVKNGLLTVSHDSGECLVKITDGEKHGSDRTEPHPLNFPSLPESPSPGLRAEVNVFEFDGEVIVRSLLDVDHEYLVPKKSERKLSIHDIEREGDI